MKFVNRFLFALSFLTRIPVPFDIEYNRKISSKSMIFYPLIGIIIGGLIAVGDRFLMVFFPADIRNILLLAFLIYLSGGLHLDGFMDTMDGIFSGRKKDKILEIMHDSQVGSFGVIGFVLLILLKYNLLLNIIPASFRVSLLILMPVWSRLMMVLLIKVFPLASSSQLGKDFKSFLTWKEAAGGSIWLVLLIIFLNLIYNFSYFNFIIIGAVVTTITLLFGYYLTKKIEGVTGDTAGAVNEIIEVVVLLVGVLIVN